MTTFSPTRISSSFPILVAIALLLALAVPLALAGERPPVETVISGGEIGFQINIVHKSSTLSAFGDDGDPLGSVTFDGGDYPRYRPSRDGIYRFRLTVEPELTREQMDELAAARLRGDNLVAARYQGPTLTGRIVVEGGTINLTGADEGEDDRDQRTRDFVIADDLIVDGSACVGFDCVNGESFGFDTIRLKENSTRIKFEDTSVGSFPSNDWQLTANDSASGGQNKFSIDDITAGRTPFTVEAGAATNALYIDSTSRVGFRTSTPVLELHVSDSDTPGLRLEQNTTGGFAAQSWDIAGNETNFFIRDVTSGSRLPFRIRPGAPTSSIDISATGKVGIGTSSPSKQLHVKVPGAVNTTALLLENAEAVRFDLFNNSTVNGGVATTWFFQADSDTNRTLKISKDGSGGTEVTINNRLDANGVTFKVDGSVQATNVIFASSRELKESFAELDPQEILAKVATLAVSKWRFKEGSKAEHIGPMAEDFHQAFGLDSDNKTISMTDTSGVALAAIQALYARVLELEAKQNAAPTQGLEAIFCPKN